VTDLEFFYGGCYFVNNNSPKLGTYYVQFVCGRRPVFDTPRCGACVLVTGSPYQKFATRGIISSSQATPLLNLPLHQLLEFKNFK